MVPIIRWEAHVDWLTLTMKGEVNEPARLRWATNTRGLLERQGGVRDSRRDKRLGYYGTAAGPVFCGARYDGDIVTVSGPEADVAARMVWPSAARATRIDLCCTCWYGEPVPGLAQNVARAVVAHREAGEPGHARRIALINGYGNGDTLYIGSRQSDQFARLYDKEQESGEAEYVNAWRWEVEYKGKAARQIFTAIPRGAMRTDAIAATVEEWFVKRGAGRGPGVATLGALRVVSPRTETTDSAKLAWLARSVAPTVKGLLTRGQYDATLEALGLADDSRESPEE